MPEQDVSDRLAEIDATLFDDISRFIFGLQSFNKQPFREVMQRLLARLREASQLSKDLSDHHQIALAYEAQVEQQAQQIGALRAEQARLRAALDAVRGKVTTTLVDEEYQALLRWRRVFLDFTVQDVEPEKLRAPQNQLVCYAIADAMTLRDIDEVLSAETPSEDDGKSARDNSPAFSQADLEDPIVALPRGVIVALLENCKHRDDVLIAWDALQAEVEQLRAENERLVAESKDTATIHLYRFVCPWRECGLATESIFPASAFESCPHCHQSWENRWPVEAPST